MRSTLRKSTMHVSVNSAAEKRSFFIDHYILLAIVSSFIIQEWYQYWHHSIATALLYINLSLLNDEHSQFI
ncbi:hypothetical protein BDB00DRAFT_799353 [Zychaea mexicana]|uniref:uncharacterized protein n=1 Tax=Zychaea mexicana TaxID=64656 RepID=UPI0022FDDC89|nr:uncharacterized protein BDB00DRAFT_799353 [Zychaea mexicana]KAI9498748.1 hypothetical protein BDB00DRAFT_799353 [Zychaea mexicana]